MENENIIIATSGTTGLLQESMSAGWVIGNIGTATISGLNYSEQITTISFNNPCNSNTFPDGEFSEFETRIVSDTGLLCTTYLPIGSYGIDMSNAPTDILTSNSLTGEQKNAISYSLSCQNKGYYVIVSVAETSTTFTGHLKSYGIPFDTPENIKKMLDRKNKK